MDEILRFAQNDNWGAQNDNCGSVTLSAAKGLIFWEVLTLMAESRHWNLLWR
jgi:hypothetical protein